MDVNCSKNRSHWRIEAGREILFKSASGIFDYAFKNYTKVVQKQYHKRQLDDFFDDINVGTPYTTSFITKRI